MTMRKVARAALARWFPAVPSAIAPALAAYQFDSIRRQVPILHMIAILNLLIVDFVLWRQHTPAGYYAWTSAIILFCLWRIVTWRRRNRAARPGPAEMGRFLAGANRAAIGSVAIVSAFAAATYLAGGFDYPLLIPISLAFGVFSIAHCLAPMRLASVATLVAGIAPCGLAMLLTGNFMAQVIAVSMMSVAALKIGFLRDYHGQMIARLALQQQIHDLAARDPLTGLANRRAIHDRIEAAIARGEDFAVALIDLDDFKGLNDSRGHHAGDAMLRLIAERLAAHAGPDGVAGRLGGDEFVVLLERVADAAAIRARMDELVAALAGPAMIEGETVAPAASLGFATFPECGRDLDALTRAADAALYAAKREGKGRARGRRSVAEAA
ncbi:GGDEF domain-containing protein [Sphingomonas gilva]|nr:diguanylate cyclase [Sphingomonas gilva]